MPLSFPKTGHPDAVVGQTPWSARVPLDPLLASEIRFIQTQQADVGVGCGPGGPPHQERRLSSFGKTKGPLRNNISNTECFGVFWWGDRPNRNQEAFLCSGQAAG
jgi:hypothetical protein